MIYFSLIVKTCYLYDATAHMSANVDEPISVPVGCEEQFVIELFLAEGGNHDD